MEKVLGDDDLLEEILLRLPAETVHACKPVSKRWCNLISSLRFRRRHGSFPLHLPSSNNSKLLLFNHEEKSAITLLDIGNGVIKTSSIESAKLLSSIQPYYEKLCQKIHGSKEICFSICDAYNGLFLLTLRTREKQEEGLEFWFNDWRELYCLVCNPLTKEYEELPLLSEHTSYTLTELIELAFAPSKHNGYYKVVVASPNQAPHGDYAECTVQIYSSQTRTWENAGHLRHHSLYDYKYVEWDNCLLLINRGLSGRLLRVLDLERLRVTRSSSLVPISINENRNYLIPYVGETGGFLYVIAEDSKFNLGKEGSKYMLWEMKGIDGSWKERFQFNTEKEFTILHVYRDGEHVWLLMWDMSTNKVCYRLNGITESLQACDVPHRYGRWNIRYHTPTLFPLG